MALIVLRREGRHTCARSGWRFGLRHWSIRGLQSVSREVRFPGNL